MHSRYPNNIKQSWIKTLQTLFFFIIASAVFLPSVALAGPSPTAAEPYCYTYDNFGILKNSCFATEPACIANSSGKKVASTCGLVGNPDASTFTVGQLNASNNPIDAQKALYVTKTKPSGSWWSWIWGGVKSAAGAAAGAVLGPVLKAIALLIFTLAGYFLTSMAIILDLSIRITLDSNILGGLAFVSVGWTAVRDLSNMFFIFALLYLAIRTILGIGGGGAKRLVANLIIAALLINFSLFFTKVVIDAGNVLAVSFWDKLKVQQGPYTISSASSKALGGLDLQTMWSDKSSKVGAQIDSLDSIVQAELYAGGAVFMFIAGYVFLAAALMMVTRTIMLLLLMVFSPFAFLSFAIPGLSRHGSEWLGKLIKQTFVAPIFLFMMYLNSVLIDSVDLLKLSGSNDATFSAALTGDPRGYAVILNFMLMIGFLLSSLAIANSFAGTVGSGARGLAKKWMGKGASYAFATGAAAGRQSLGRGGKASLNNEAWMKKQRELVAKAGMKDATLWDKSAGRMANLKVASAEKLAKGTFDVRNAPLQGFGFTTALKAGGIEAGPGTKKSYEATGQAGSSLTGGYRGTEKEKELIDLAKSRYFEDYEAQQAFFKARGVDLSAPRNKALKAEIERGMVTQGHKKTIKAAPEEIREQQAQIDTLKKDQADGKPINEKQLVDTEAKLAIATTGLMNAVKGLTGKEFVDTVKQGMIAEKDKDGNLVVKPEIIRAMGRQQLAYLNTNPDAYDPDVQKAITEEVMLNGQPEARQYLIGQVRMNNGAFPPDLKVELQKRADKYEANMKDWETRPNDQSPEGQKRREAEALLREEHDSAVQDILAGMPPKEIASMKELDLKSNPTIARHYTKKHLESIDGYHKNIAQDWSNPKTAAALVNIREGVKNGTNGEAKKFMNNASTNPESAFFDKTAKTSGAGSKGKKEGADDAEDTEDEADDNSFPTT